MLRNSKFIALTLLAAVTGCASTGSKQTSTAYADYERLAATTAAGQKNSQYDASNSGSSMKVDRPYFGVKSIPLKGDPVLPEVFMQMKRFVFPGQTFTISEAAAQISQISGIQVRVAQDVARDPASKEKAGPITMETTASTAGILDQVTAVDGLSWEYSDGVVYIKRYITRSFRIKSVLGSRKHTYSAGTTGNTTAQSSAPGGSSGGSLSTGFTSNTTASATTDIDPFKSIEVAVKAVLSKPNGTVVATGTNSLIVTDTAEGLRKAADIIERENEILTRNVTFRVQVLSFTADDNDQAGFDLNALYKNINKFGFSMSSPGSIVSASAGTLGVQVLSNGTPGHMDGSSIILKLLSERGKTVSVHDVNVPTRNLVSTPLNLTTQIPYLAKSTPAPSGPTGTSGGTPGLELGTAVVGFKMDLTPNILDSNSISLQLAIGLVDLLEIRKVSSGQNLGSLESPVTSGFELAPELFLKPYETAVITGYERTTNKFSRSALGEDVPLLLGGSYSTSGKKEKLFVLITPTIVGNAY